MHKYGEKDNREMFLFSMFFHLFQEFFVVYLGEKKIIFQEIIFFWENFSGLFLVYWENTFSGDFFRESYFFSGEVFFLSGDSLFFRRILQFYRITGFSCSSGKKQQRKIFSFQGEFFRNVSG